MLMDTSKKVWRHLSDMLIRQSLWALPYNKTLIIKRRLEKRGEILQWRAVVVRGGWEMQAEDVRASVWGEGRHEWGVLSQVILNKGNGTGHRALGTAEMSFETLWATLVIHIPKNDEFKLFKPKQVHRTVSRMIRETESLSEKKNCLTNEGWEGI